MTDETLAVRAKGGDREAFGELVERYQGRLFSFLTYRAGRSAAEDLFQEICVKWWTNMPGYEPRGRFAAWAFTVARRALIDHGEKESRRAMAPLDETTEPADALPSPEREAESREAGRALSRALARLSDEQREVFLLREYGGLSFKEIAAAQGCPLNTALARMRYALLKLRGALEVHHG